jgi:hypothetical protein
MHFQKVYNLLWELLKAKQCPLCRISVKRLSAAFCARDYVITSKELRTSFDFNDIYHKYYINELNPNRFFFFENLKDYNFNYNYQIGSHPEELNQILNKEASNIPKYLEDMKGIWEPAVQRRAVLLNKAVNFSIAQKKENVPEK